LLTYLWKKTPPPLYDFMQWLDIEQSDFDKSYVEGEARDARERWLRMVEWEKREGKKEEQKEEMRECEAAQAREADRERKRERARRAKAAGPDAIRKGNTPAVLSRPGVLAGLYQIYNTPCFCSVPNCANNSLNQVPNHPWSTLSQNPTLNPSYSL
jgi:hypothetical protein